MLTEADLVRAANDTGFQVEPPRIQGCAGKRSTCGSIVGWTSGRRAMANARKRKGVDLR